MQLSAAGGAVLFWPLAGPTLEASGLAVMAGPTNPDVRAPYYDAAAGAWHPVGRLPISEPRVSSITVRVSDLEDWAGNWEETHCDYVADEEGGDGAGNGCCGMERPAGKDASIVVTGTGGVTEGGGGAGGAGGDFVSVHDFVAAVHPWLMGLRSDILGALGTLNGDDRPLPAETELMVSCNMLDSSMMEKRADWIRHAKKEPLPAEPGFSLREILARNAASQYGLFVPVIPIP